FPHLHQNTTQLVLAPPIKTATPICVLSRLLDDFLITRRDQYHPDVRVRLELGQHRSSHHVVLHRFPLSTQWLCPITSPACRLFGARGGADGFLVLEILEFARLIAMFAR